MAIFSDKIIEAYYTNKEKNTIEVIYKDGEKAISHYLTYDPSHPDFQDLLKEYGSENLLKTTTNRLNGYRSQLKKVVSDYQQGALKVAEDEVNSLRNNFFSSLINFDIENQKHLEFLFTLKLKIFELDVVKNSTDTEKKDLIRNSKTILEVLNILKDIK
jgi:hypothetical protein